MDKRIEFNIEGYDYCHTGIEVDERYLVSKYIMRNDKGDILPIIDWKIDLEWMSKECIDRMKKIELILDES